MSELTRFHKGKLGPVSFADLNDMLERLDRIEQLAESVATKVSQKTERRTDSFLVEAIRGTGEDDDKYSWREIIMQQDDKLLKEEDDDFVKLSRRKQFRSGEILDDKGMLTDTYATSISPDFPGGTATCQVVYPIQPDDNSGINAKYLLTPVASVATPGNEFIPELGFFEISSTPQIENFNLVSTDGGDTQFKVKKYKAFRYDPAFGSFGGVGQIGFTKSNSETNIYETMFDVDGEDANLFLNRPDIEGTSPSLTQRAIDVGTVVTCNYWFDRVENSGGSWWMSHIPVLDLTCQGG